MKKAPVISSVAAIDMTAVAVAEVEASATQPRTKRRWKSFDTNGKVIEKGRGPYFPKRVTPSWAKPPEPPRPRKPQKGNFSNESPSFQGVLRYLKGATPKKRMKKNYGPNRSLGAFLGKEQVARLKQMGKPKQMAAAIHQPTATLKVEKKAPAVLVQKQIPANWLGEGTYSLKNCAYVVVEENSKRYATFLLDGVFAQGEYGTLRRVASKMIEVVEQHSVGKVFIETEFRNKRLLDIVTTRYGLKEVGATGRRQTVLYQISKRRLTEFAMATSKTNLLTVQKNPRLGHTMAASMNQSTITLKIKQANAPRLAALKSEKEIVKAHLETGCSLKPATTFEQFMLESKVVDMGTIEMGRRGVQVKLLVREVSEGRFEILGAKRVKGSANLKRKIGTDQLITATADARYLDKVTAYAEAVKRFAEQNKATVIDLIYHAPSFPALTVLKRRGISFEVGPVIPYRAYGVDNRLVQATLQIGEKKDFRVLGSKKLVLAVPESSKWLEYIPSESPKVANAFGVVQSQTEGLVYKQGNAFKEGGSLVFQPTKGGRGSLFIEEAVRSKLSPTDQAKQLINEIELISMVNTQASYSVIIEGNTVLKQVIDEAKLLAEGSFKDKGKTYHVFMLLVR